VEMNSNHELYFGWENGLFGFLDANEIGRIRVHLRDYIPVEMGRTFVDGRGELHMVDDVSVGKAIMVNLF
jgi:hypothetical protein